MNLVNTKNINESDGPHEFGCLMLNIKDSIFYSDYQDKIKKSDLAEDGLEDTFHLTILYGITLEASEHAIFNFISSFNPFNIKIKSSKISLFENDKFDVVKFDVELTEELQILRDFVINEFPNVQTFSTYLPHLTIAYVKKGTGKKYIDNFLPVIFEIKNVVYSRSDGSKIESKIF